MANGVPFNMVSKITGNILTITIDLSTQGYETAGGNHGIASSHGRIDVGGGVYVNLNCYSMNRPVVQNTTPAPVVKRGRPAKNTPVVQSNANQGLDLQTIALLIAEAQKRGIPLSVSK